MDAQGEDFSPAWVQSGFDALCFELSCLIGGQEQFAEGIRCSCIKLHAITSYWSEIRLPVASFASNSTPSSTVQSPSRISLPHHLHLPKAPTADLPHTCRMPFATPMSPPSQKMILSTLSSVLTPFLMHVLSITRPLFFTRSHSEGMRSDALAESDYIGSVLRLQGTRLVH